MKYDCYPRFLKSDEYNRCWTMAVEKNETLPCMRQKFLNNVNDAQLQYQKEFDAHLSRKFSGSAVSLHKTIQDFEKDHVRHQLAGDEYQKKRKSLLPWKSNFIGRSNNNTNSNNNNNNKDKRKNNNNSAENMPANAQMSSQKQKSQQQHPRSTLSKFPTFEIDNYRQSAANNLTADRKHAWRSGKHASTPAAGSENLHLYGQLVGSSRESWISNRSSHEGEEECFVSVAVSSASSPFSSNILLIPPPDVVPHPDPPSSPKNCRSSLSNSHVANDAISENYLPPLRPSSSPTILSQCTIILPFREKVLADLEPNISVKEWLYKNAPIWNLNPDATDILDFTTNESVELSQPAERVLANKTIRLEGGVLFKLEIPLIKDQKIDSSLKRKLIGVKAASDSTAAQALRPILSKYGLNLDEMIVTITGSNEILPNHAPISQADNRKLIVLTQEEFQEWVHRDSRELRQHTGCDSMSHRSTEEGHWPTGDVWHVEYV
uniref:BRCT domain-containing protein n=1 Tax=Romanomermis culicivorax TaxID=13658 RepID=A0A915KEN3_ROMCU